MGVLNLIRKIYFNQKTLIKNIFYEVCIRFFINAGIGWNFTSECFMPNNIPFLYLERYGSMTIS